VYLIIQLSYFDFSPVSHILRDQPRKTLAFMCVLHTPTRQYNMLPNGKGRSVVIHGVWLLNCGGKKKKICKCQGSIWTLLQVLRVHSNIAFTCMCVHCAHVQAGMYGWHSCMGVCIVKCTSNHQRHPYHWWVYNKHLKGPHLNQAVSPHQPSMMSPTTSEPNSTYCVIE